MKVDRITANIRYSQDSGKGAWKALELAAEASVAPNENWRHAQSQLYVDLAQQFKELWSTNGAAPPAHQNGHQMDGAESAPVEQPEHPEHWCSPHNTEFTRQNKGQSVWYSHRLAEGGWCNEPRK